MATTSVRNESYTKHRSDKGIATILACSATMEGTDTTTARHVLKRGLPNQATTSAKDNTSSNKQSGAKGVTISHILQSGLPNMAAISSRDNSSSKQRRAKGIKKEKASSATMEMEETSSNKALVNFGRLLTLYQSSPTPPLLPCPWSACNFVTQAAAMEDGKPVGAEPYIAIQLLELHVGHAHTEDDPEFLSFRVLQKLLLALPREPPHGPAGPHTATGHQAGHQEGAVDEVVQQVESVPIISPNLAEEKQEEASKISLLCQLCAFVTQQLKPSKADQRLRSHHFSQHASSPSPTSHEVHSQPVVPPPSPRHEVHSQPAAHSSPSQSVNSQPVPSPSSHHGDHSQPVPSPSPQQQRDNSQPFLCLPASLEVLSLTSSSSEEHSQKVPPSTPGLENCSTATGVRHCQDAAGASATVPGPSSQGGLGEEGALVGTTTPSGPSPPRGTGQPSVRQHLIGLLASSGAVSQSSHTSLLSVLIDIDPSTSQTLRGLPPLSSGRKLRHQKQHKCLTSDNIRLARFKRKTVLRGQDIKKAGRKRKENSRWSVRHVSLRTHSYLDP
jgi:hypothetical protein